MLKHFRKIFISQSGCIASLYQGLSGCLSFLLSSEFDSKKGDCKVQLVSTHFIYCHKLLISIHFDYARKGCAITPKNSIVFGACKVSIYYLFSFVSLWMTYRFFVSWYLFQRFIRNIFLYWSVKNASEAMVININLIYMSKIKS